MIWLVVGIAKSQQECGEDFSPCFCSEESRNYRYVECSSVENEEIIQIFNRTSSQYNYSVTVDFLRNEIPADIFSDKRVSSIKLRCGWNSDLPIIDPNAFRSSRNYTSKFVLFSCNLQRMNSKFLEGFDQLQRIEIESASHIQPFLATLPTLRNLFHLSFSVENDFVANMEFDTSSILSPTLTELYMTASFPGWDELAIGWTLGWLSQRNSTDNLVKVWMSGNAMSRTPPEFAFINKFTSLIFTSNAVPMTVSSGSFHFENPSYYIEDSRALSLSSCRIVDIEAGAFQGNFSRSTHIYLSDNQLTRFEENVFYPVLEGFAMTDNYHLIHMGRSTNKACIYKKKTSPRNN